MRSLRLISITGLLVTAALASGQDITLRVDYPRVVSVGEQIRIAYTVNTSGGDFSAPQFDGFYKLSGPNVSYSMSTQIINGKRTSETSYSYVFYLQATREGKFTIPPARYIKDKKEFLSEQAEIEVIRDARTGAGQAAVQQSESKQSVRAESDMFVRIELDKSQVYAGEPVTATVKFYTRTEIAGVSEIKYPVFNGFLKEEIETQQPTSLVRENIDGTIYGTAVFQRFLLYPQRSGELTIDPVQLTVLIRQRSGASDPFFGDFFQTFTNVPRVIASQPQTVKVKPLPAGQPEGFPGAVGKFNISAILDKDSVAANDAAILKVTISGKGNFRLADAPVIAFPAGLEVYDPKTTTNVTHRESGSTGSRVFEYLIIPRSPGEFTIPAVGWSYFDPSSAGYITVSAKPLKLYVSRPATQQTGPQVYTPAAGEDIKYLGSDIRFIRTGVPELRRQKVPLISKRSYYTSYGLSLTLFIAIIILRREQVRRNSDKARVLNRKAAKLAGKRIDYAFRQLERDGADKFHEEILKALWGYVSDKTNLPVSDLTSESASEALRSMGADVATTREFIELAGECELLRYAPASIPVNPQEIHRKAVRLIRELENQLQ